MSVEHPTEQGRSPRWTPGGQGRDVTRQKNGPAGAGPQCSVPTPDATQQPIRQRRH